jgi:hypothetical protein
MKITEDDRDILLGFDGQRHGAVAQAQAEAQRYIKAAHAQIDARQAAYLGRLAERLGIKPEEIGKYRINLETLTLES